MRIACIGDIHLIDKDEPHQGMVKTRAFFMPGQKSLLELFKKLENSDIDLVVFLGDLVDWASEENISFALKLLSHLSIPWKAVPGNHDFAIAHADITQKENRFATTAHRKYRTLWQKHNISMENQFIDCGEFGLVLLDNSMSNIEEQDLQWLDAQLNIKKHNMVCQHVPLSLPEIDSCIHSIAPNRHLSKYTCSAHPDLYHSHYENRVQAVLSGHVHIDASVTTGDCTHHLCNVGISMNDPGRNEDAVASATIISFADGCFHRELLSLNS
ncbi:MAG: metallophosphoesterase [Planctomycetes bacterium]|nr:metallophosphoesterase [Planctomycetota bacterium]